MSTKINTKKYTRYMGFDSAETLLNELKQSEYSDQISFRKANEALSFLKLHNEDNEFEREASTTAIIKAIAYLESFEKELLDLMISGMAEDERKKEVSKKAHSEAQKIINSKIMPSLEKLLSDIESLNSVGSYSPNWFRYDLQGMQKQIKQAMRV